MTRPNTPAEELPDGRRRVTVKRRCDRCGRELGDATAAELRAAEQGDPMPAVLDECGCMIATAAVAALDGHRFFELLQNEIGGYETCECGEPLRRDLIGQDALDQHLIDVVHDAIATVRA